MTEIEFYLSSFNVRTISEEKDSEIQKQIIERKKSFVSSSDEVGAKQCWIYQQTLLVQQLYLKSFSELKEYKFYDAWCTLERCEIEIKSLMKHTNKEQNKSLWLNFISDHVFRYQSIYPYKIFMSPEIIEKKIVCSICGAVISIRNHCGHEVGEIYNGEYCFRIVEKAEFIGMAMVENPVQKYSVPFLSDEKGGEKKDHYNYQVVKYLIDALISPYDEWQVQHFDKLHSHSAFLDIGRNEKCPCGSNKKYKKCCLPKDGVLMPHYEFIFSKEPPKGFEKQKFI